MYRGGMEKAVTHRVTLNFLERAFFDTRCGTAIDFRIIFHKVEGE